MTKDDSSWAPTPKQWMAAIGMLVGITASNYGVGELVISHSVDTLAVKVEHNTAAMEKNTAAVVKVAEETTDNGAEIAVVKVKLQMAMEKIHRLERLLEQKGR